MEKDLIMPYYEMNEEWYMDNPEFKGWKAGEYIPVDILTEKGKAIPEVVESYNSYHETLKKAYLQGIEI